MRPSAISAIAEQTTRPPSGYVQRTVYASASASDGDEVDLVGHVALVDVAQTGADLVGAAQAQRRGRRVPRVDDLDRGVLGVEAGERLDVVGRDGLPQRGSVDGGGGR